MVRFIGRLYPKFMRKNFEDLMRYCNIKTDVDTYLSFVTILSAVLAVFVALLVQIFVSGYFFMILPVSFVIIIFTVHMNTTGKPHRSSPVSQGESMVCSSEISISLRGGWEPCPMTQPS